MAVCLNTKSALILYEELVNSPYFVDKFETPMKCCLPR